MNNLFIFSLLFFSFLSVNTPAQKLDSAHLYPVVVAGKWGYINCSGMMLIDAEYDYALNFSRFQKQALVRKGRLYSVIDIQGNELIPFSYQKLIRCSVTKDAFAYLYIAFDGEKYGVINLRNEIVIPFEYDYIKPVLKLFAVKKGKLWGLLNSDADLISPVQWIKIDRTANLLCAESKEKKWAVFTAEGKKICKPLFDYSKLTVSEYYINGFANAKALTIDFKGNIQKRLKMHVTGFNHPLYSVALGLNGLYGLVDNHFNWIVPPAYQKLKLHTDERDSLFLLYSENDNWGILSLNEEILLKPSFKKLIFISEEIIAASEDGNWYGLYNLKLYSWLPNHKYSFCYVNKYTETVEVNSMPKDDNTQKWGVLDFKGNVIIPPQFAEAVSFNNRVEVIQYEDKVSKGIFSLTKNKIIIPPLFSDVICKSNLLTQIIYKEKQRNFLAWVDSEGKIVWSSYGFDAQKLFDDYFYNIIDKR
jgi:hypothetical protein